MPETVQYVYPGETVLMTVAHSEVAMSMGVAGRRTLVHLQATQPPMAQLIDAEGHKFSAPILPAEAGFYFEQPRNPDSQWPHEQEGRWYFTDQERPLRTVADLIAELQHYPPDWNIAGYVDDAEDGGDHFQGITVQREDDEESWLYYKGENPHNYKTGLGNLVTIVSAP